MGFESMNFESTQSSPDLENQGKESAGRVEEFSSEELERMRKEEGEKAERKYSELMMTIDRFADLNAELDSFVRAPSVGWGMHKFKFLESSLNNGSLDDEYSPVAQTFKNGVDLDRVGRVIAECQNLEGDIREKLTDFENFYTVEATNWAKEEQNLGPDGKTPYNAMRHMEEKVGYAFDARG